MFVGHLGLAYLGKAVRREVPLPLLAFAAFLPDLLRLPLDMMGVGTSERLTHSIPAVLSHGLTIGAAWALTRGLIGGAVIVALVCMLHWPADVLTGCKPTVPAVPWVGFNNYRYPLIDFPVELLLLTLGWLACRRRGMSPATRAYRWWVPLLACCFQLGFLAVNYIDSEFFIGNREWTWHPREGLLEFRRVRDTETLYCRTP